MSMLGKLSRLARSPQARAQAQRLAGKARQVASDPRRRAQLESAKRRFGGRRGGPGAAA
jgi:hypothetical protein